MQSQHFPVTLRPEYLGKRTVEWIRFLEAFQGALVFYMMVMDDGESL